jgi:hypothetical protein
MSDDNSREPDLNDIGEQIFKRVNRSEDFALPVFDGPIDRVLSCPVTAVMDLISGLDLLEVHDLVTLLIERKLRPMEDGR